MSGFKAKINDKEFNALLNDLKHRVNNLKPAFKVIGENIIASIQRNFRVGGRPDKWKPLSDVTIEQRKKKKKWPGRILMQTGGLIGSLHSVATNRKAIVSANKKYAAVHQFGAKKGEFGEFIAHVKSHMRSGKRVRAHTRRIVVPWGDIPARPFMLVQNEDYEDIKYEIVKFILHGRR